MTRIIEEEQALIIKHEQPDLIASLVREITQLGPFDILKMPKQNMVDTYYDTPARELKAAKISLRIRTVETQGENKTLVTWKGGNKAYTGVQKREEFETEWPLDVDPALVFGVFEMEPVQVRTNLRRPSLVLSEGEAVAELAIDDVEYQYANGSKARLWEVEVELIDSVDNTTKLEDIVKPLVAEFPELTPWKHSKFSTGKAIEKILGIKQRDDGTLSPGSYEFISSLIK